MTQVTAEYPVVSAPTSPSPAKASPPPGPAVAGDPAAVSPDGPETVEWAAATPDDAQPHAELGLTDDEYERIRQILGRRPTRSELAMYSIMWSEHCSYKSSKIHLRQFSQKAPEGTAAAGRVLAGIGENAGVVRISEQLAVTFKVESHNHPSFVEPYQGAATGVGGIVRDILAMGARPVAIMDPLRFGAATHEDTARVLPGVVAGVGGYGNCQGLPDDRQLRIIPLSFGQGSDTGPRVRRGLVTAGGGRTCPARSCTTASEPLTP
jgi:phosphoribosylformylglycinamidine synthase